MSEQISIHLSDALMAIQIVEENTKALFTLLDHGKGPRLDRGPGAREAAITLTRVQDARHWLEECKQILRDNA